MSRRVVVLGATKGIGRVLARQLAARGDRLCLLGRSLPDLEASARDLEQYSSDRTPVESIFCDLEQLDSIASALDGAERALGGFDTVIVTAALFALQDALATDAELTRRLLQVDFVNTVLFCEAARTRLLARGGGTLCVFSSVAGDRARRRVVLYGAAKAGLSAYLEGLDHAYRRHGLVTVCVKPGFVRTSMTEGLPEPPIVSSAESVARTAVRAIDRGTPVVYAPRIWWPIMLFVRSLPRAVMRRVGF